tara:strand:- start:145 stop:783 length:639 start_codon:yes stop_codon:yes gene_type:complete
MKNKHKIIIIDDHQIFGEGFCSLLEANNYNVKRVFQEPVKALNYIKKNKTDIVFSDINMPKINGIDLIEKIKKINDEIKIIIISMYSEKSIINQAFKKNADGYLGKNCSLDDIKKAIKNSFSDKKAKNLFIENETLDAKDPFSLKYKLTKREKEIIDNILDQKSNSEIGDALSISKRTVETHRKNIMLKLNVKNSIGIAVKCLENGLIKEIN